MLLFYETGSYSARLSYNWRDDFVASAGNARQPSRVEDAFGLLDMSLSYAVNDSLVARGDLVRTRADPGALIFFQTGQRKHQMEGY